MVRYFSGINPSSTSGLHIGNYFGAVKQHVEFQAKGDCFYMIADYHALNTVFNADELATNIKNIYIEYLALGLDPEKATFFIESDVPEITELAELLSNVITYGQMQRMHAFKDKLADGASQESINMGLFNYPVLMAADILLFNPNKVPVGEDQRQHVEVARDIALAFNKRYGDLLVVPELEITQAGAKVLGTDGVRKMSKSLGNDISIFADADKIKKQVMSIVTDPNRIHADDPGDPNKNIAFTYLKLLEFDAHELADFENRYKQGKVGDSEIKQALYDHLMEYFASFRKRKLELENNSAMLNDIREMGKTKAQQIAHENIAKLVKATGLKRF